MGCAAPRVIIDVWYPRDAELVRRLHSRGLVDAAFAPDIPFGAANADSLLASWILHSQGVPSIAAISLGSRGPAASASRILTAYLSGVDGILVVAGDSRQCPGAMGVLDAIRMAAALPEVRPPEGVKVSSALASSLERRPCFLIGAAVDPSSERSLRLARSKAEAGANILVSQLLPDPAAAAGALSELRPLGIPVALGIPYAPTEGARARFESLFGLRAPSPRELLASLERVPRDLRSHLYVSPIGADRSGLEGFLESLASLRENSI